jgi:hypothetical protein
MSDVALLIPIAAITIGPVAWVVNNWVRARHGYPIETKKGQLVSRDGDLSLGRQTDLLKAENEKLHGQVSRLEERLAVLERIATDPAERVSREIDALR